MSDFDASRSYQRAKGIAPVICDRLRGRLIDISRSGFAFSTTSDFDYFSIGQICQFTIKLPRPENSSEALTLQVTGIIRNIAMDEDKQRMTLGVEFKDLAEQTRQQLNRIILFFAESFAPLKGLDNLLNALDAPPKNPEKKQELPQKLQEKIELGNIFTQLIERYELLPATIQEDILQLAKEIKSRIHTGS
ncbi:MAG: PilZ domain-containing protein [SAR324 cluster bacterium]|nr:PilZ domain-containing protein [SAR324 cluster bacterium]